MKYSYSNADLLEFPQKYQMTPFEGRGFISSYEQSRKDVLDKINQNPAVNSLSQTLELIKKSSSTNEKENKRRDKVPIPADMRLIGPCNSEKGALCIMPGLTFRMFVMNEQSKVIVDKTYTRKDCAWLENILDPFQYK